MERAKNFIIDHKIEFAAALVCASSIAALVTLKKKQQEIYDIMITSSRQHHIHSEKFMTDLQRKINGPVEEANLVKAMKVINYDQLEKFIPLLTKNLFTDPVKLVQNIRKSNIDLHYDVIYSYTTPSTQKILYNYFDEYPNPILYVADFQSHGRGRRDNYWVSPKGSISMTFTNIIKVDHIVVIQYLVSLAVHEAIQERTGEKFTLKWPNDTYYDTHKISGNIVQATDFKYDHMFKKIFVGIGINLDNPEPTTCINSILVKKGKKKVEPEQLILDILLKFQEILQSLEEQGWDNGLALRYLKHWEDYQIEAELVREEGSQPEKVKINGIDKQGNLVVVNQSNEAVALNPNKYSYDAINKVFYLKK